MSKTENLLQIANLVVNLQTHEVRRGSKIIHLSEQEYKMLELLMKNRGKVISRNTILDYIWVHSHNIQTRIVDVYIGYLRKKLDSNTSQKLIYSVRGSGYMIKV
ncbi:MAG: winged helix-turn-helix domain-containing protein [Candidatus Roizmanbacteria bacterium]